MTTYTWKIESVNEDAGTMLVEFTHDEDVVVLNLPTPPAPEQAPPAPPVDPAAPPLDPAVPSMELGAWIDRFAPRQAWVPKPPSNITIGETGSTPIELPVPVVLPDTPQIVGSSNETYLRTLIHQVLEEIKNAPAPPPSST